MDSPIKWREDTQIIRGPKEESESTTGAHRIPLYQTSTFVFENAENAQRAFKEIGTLYIYTRMGNPTINYLEEKLAFLEGTESGAACSSGMGAISTLIFTLVKPGEKIVASEPLYGGTYKFFQAIKDRLDIEIVYLPAINFTEEIEDKLDERTKLVFIETPANPTLDIVDIGRTAEISHRRGIPVAVDNTFSTPYLQKPIRLGADIVVYSMTKYLSGHGDTIGGIIVGKRDFIKKLKEGTLYDFGSVLAPFNAWLILRGIKTLGIRMRKHSENAMKIAEFLERHQKVKRVFYPGLPSHPQHELGKKQMEKGFSGMVSFIVKGGRAAGKKVMNSVKLWTLAVSLGDTDSLIEHPASMTHASYTEEELKLAGIDEGLIRLSVGLEDPDDLIDDLNQALNKI